MALNIFLKVQTFKGSIQKYISGLLICDKKLHLDNFKKFINKLSLKENGYLEKILFIRDKQHKKFKNMFHDIYQ